MSSLSVSGKKWILKDVKQEDVRYIKDNFLLDEIVSKLLAIRNIKKEEIQTFLNPLIKNILPNPFVPTAFQSDQNFNASLRLPH